MSDSRKPAGGVPAVLEILQLLDPASRERLLQNLALRDESLARKLRESLFTFADLVGLTPLALQALLRETPEPLLTLALRQAQPELLDKIFASMSKRQAASVRDELANGAKKPLTEVQSAQAKIIEIARRLEGEGKLLLRRSE